MSYPPCFQSQEQFDAWAAADRNTYHYGKDRMTPVCVDCTPTYAASMRLEERCEHPEVKFYRYRNAYRGGAHRGIADPFEKWEKVDEQEQSDAALPCTDEGAGVSLRDNRTPPA